MEMVRRRIAIDVLVSGNLTAAITKQIKKDLAKDPTVKIIWYTNSKRKAEELLVPAAEGVLEALGIEGGGDPTNWRKWYYGQSLCCGCFRQSRDIASCEA